MTDPKAESYVFVDVESVEIETLRGKRMTLIPYPPSMFGIDTLDEAEAWITEKLAATFKRTEGAKAEEGIKKPSPQLGGPLNGGASVRYLFREETLKRLAESMESRPPEAPCARGEPDGYAKVRDMIQDAIRKAIAEGEMDVGLPRLTGKGDLGSRGPEMILPLGRQDDSRLLAAAAAPVPSPPVTMPVLFDDYPLQHVVGYSLLEQWVDVLVFDDDRPIWRDGRWLTYRLNGKVEAIGDRKDRA